MPKQDDSESLTELSESEAEQPEKYTDEWYDSVEKRFEDLGNFIKSGRSGHHESTAATTPATPSEGQSPSGASAEVNGDAGSTRDTKPPKPSHVYFRNIFGG
jgi:hypothetical protein